MEFIDFTFDAISIKQVLKFRFKLIIYKNSYFAQYQSSSACLGHKYIRTWTAKKKEKKILKYKEIKKKAAQNFCVDTEVTPCNSETCSTISSQCQHVMTLEKWNGK